MALQGEFILLPTRDPKFLNQHLGGLPHVQAANRIGKPQLKSDLKAFPEI